jgi:DNA topoisomerase-1
LWKKIRYGLSAGRVQSVAVKIIVDREKERDEFEPEEYWNMVAFLLEEKSGDKGEKIETKLIKSEDKLPDAESEEIKFDLVKFKGKKVDFKSEKQVKDLLDSLKDKTWEISEIKKKQTNRYPKPPFTTSTMQQTAANWFGFSAKRTMMAAQKLYEAGLITYMRTDSTNMSSQAVAAARKYIENTLSDKYIPEKPKFYKTKAKVAQEAHEAIRPSDFTKKPRGQKFSGRGAKDQKKLYQLIWQRALASQMSNAKVENINIIVDHDLSQGKAKFKANGQRILFKGYLEIYPEKFTEALLPEMKEGQEIYLNRLFGTQHFTQPPARYSEATLIKQLEKYGIGRPSTYAPIISTIQQRKYVEKEGKYFKPTDTGKVVTRLLAEHFPQIVDLDFTAGMEDSLDEIATGDVDWKDFLSKFYEPFEKKLKKKEKEIEREDFTVMGDAPKDIKCPECGGKMLIKLGRYGKFYSCAKFPDCKGMLGLDGETPEEVQAKAKTDKFKEFYKPAPKTDDGRDYVLKKGRFGEFWAHPDYPKVKDAKPLEYKDDKLEELFGEAPETKDGRKYEFRTGRYGKFWAHPDYPKVKKTKKIKKNPKID